MGSGSLNVLYGNLHLGLAAEHEPRMPAPADFNALVAASRIWQEPPFQRQEQAIELARAVVAALPR